ncbi:MAG: hypothetical protein ABI830_04865 [Pseudolabrys sp.]
MNRILPAVALISAYLAMSATAFASANVSCAIDDANLDFELEAIAGRSGPINQVQVGSITLKAGTAKFVFDRSHIIRQWDYDGDMRLQIEVEDEPTKAHINLYIFARLNRKTDKYSGRYVLKISKAGAEKELKGRIKECEVG